MNYRRHKLPCSSYSSAWILSQDFACRASFWRFCMMEPQCKTVIVFPSITILHTLGYSNFSIVLLVFIWFSFFTKAIYQTLRVTLIFRPDSLYYGPTVSTKLLGDVFFVLSSHEFYQVYRCMEGLKTLLNHWLPQRTNKNLWLIMKNQYDSMLSTIKVHILHLMINPKTQSIFYRSRRP